MKFTLGWLRDHLDTDAPLDVITDALTRIGLELEGVTDPGAALRPFVVARVVSAEQHPNADRLRVCMVDAGSGEPVQVVCGAPNARAGLRTVFAKPGSYIPGLDTTLKVGEIRGVESRGMLLSLREMKLGEDHSGIAELPEDAPVGTPYPVFAGMDDPVIEIGVTPNRGDALGVRGIARDLAAAGIGTLKPWAPVPVPGAFPSPIRWAIESPACPWVLGRTIRGVRNGPSPAWLQRRLTAIGLRPINALVDITNFFAFDLCRPLARVRCRQGGRRRADDAPRRGRELPRAERQGLHGRPRRLHHRRRERHGVAGGRDGRRIHRVARTVPPACSSNARCSTRLPRRSLGAGTRSRRTRASASSAASTWHCRRPRWKRPRR